MLKWKGRRAALSLWRVGGRPWRQRGLIPQCLKSRNGPPGPPGRRGRVSHLGGHSPDLCLPAQRSSDSAQGPGGASWGARPRGRPQERVSGAGTVSKGGCEGAGRRRWGAGRGRPGGAAGATLAATGVVREPSRVTGHAGCLDPPWGWGWGGAPAARGPYASAPSGLCSNAAPWGALLPPTNPQHPTPPGTRVYLLCISRTFCVFQVYYLSCLLITPKVKNLKAQTVLPKLSLFCVQG